MADGGIWPGLYRWSIEYHDGTVPHGLSQEDRDFLQNAIREALSKQENPAKVLQEQVAILDRFENGSPDVAPRDLLAALSVVQRLVDDYPEIARDFEKLGAIPSFLRLLTTCSAAAQAHEGAQAAAGRESETSRDSALASKTVKTALAILSLVLANNPHVQDAVYKQQGVALLMNLVKEAPPNSSLRVKALTALACQLRHHRASEVAFVNAGGAALLVHAMHSTNEKYQEKAASLMRHLLLEGLMPYEHVQRFDFASALGALLDKSGFENIQFGETIIQLAIALLQQHRVAMAKAPVLAGLREALLARRQRLTQTLTELKGREAGREDLTLVADDFTTQLALLDEAISIAKFPGMKPVEAAADSAARRGGQAPQHSKMLAM
ncbi:hypothetical protein BESB_007640 [Besnoitia besnoiti]|uniref:Uncharacterized protein n=1 Tax=Besnoitia besnoiti TaxID=94643 RepID=A0A2A9MQR6_BESBE|nr:hypothetical protein BESB_007640 [Besnoitia besnoiti]PFH38422.1 hypothetical protein BESB_007640 [Besnoitia besnoiti]